MRDSAIVAAKDLEKVLRLKKRGFTLDITPMKDGRFHVVCDSNTTE